MFNKNLEDYYCTLFPIVSFPEVSHKGFNEAIYVQLTRTVCVYSFLHKPFFPLDFSDGVFNEA